MVAVHRGMPAGGGAWAWAGLCVEGSSIWGGGGDIDIIQTAHLPFSSFCYCATSRNLSKFNHIVGKQLSYVTWEVVQVVRV